MQSIWGNTYEVYAKYFGNVQNYVIPISTSGGIYN